MSSIANNILDIKSRIKEKSKDAVLVAVSKYRNTDEIEQAIAAGQRVFGENRVQEALAKWPDIKKKYPEIELHLIGPLQTNKVKDALKIFDVIEVVDRPKLVTCLLNEIKKLDKIPEFYIQVNTGGEPQKAGILPQNADEFIVDTIKSGLPIKGLMCIPPVGEEASVHFKMLYDMATRHNLPNISMGMSADFEIALECGATHVRVGTQIFGERG